MFKIEKGIPVAQRITGKSKYPFAEMNIGDSFFVPCEEGMSKGTRSRLSIAAAKNKHIMLCTVRKVAGGFRVWRIA